MAVPAHAFVGATGASPTSRVGVASVGAHLVAANAVRGGALVVAACAQQDVASRVASVEGASLGVGTDPTRRVGVRCTEQVAAHSALKVARIAGLRRVAARALRRLSPGLDGMPYQEIAFVHLMGIDLLRPPALAGQLLGNVVAGGALRLGVTRLTELALLHRHLPVVTRKCLVVSEEGLRRRLGQIARLVTARALASLPFSFVLVTREALAHGWQGRGAALHHTAMTGHALSLNLGHCEVLVVVETDLAARRQRLGEQRIDAAYIAAMTAGA